MPLMRNRSVLVLVLVAVAFSAAATGCDADTAMPGSPAPPAVKLSETDSAPVDVIAGQPIEIRLTAQIGAGFSWGMEGIAGQSIALIDSTMETPSGGPPLDGGPQVQVFRFSSRAPGRSVVTFIYRRPWLSDPPTKRFQATIDVRAP